MTRRCLLLLVLLGLWFCCPAIDAAPKSRRPDVIEAAPKISEIRVQGNRKIERAAIDAKILSKTGEVFSQDDASADIRAIYSLGYFDEIYVDTDETAEGVVVTYVVREKPIIVSIKYEGLDALDKEDLKDLVLIHEYEVLDVNKLNQSVEKMIGKYEEKGFYLAEIRTETLYNPDKTEATVIFKIEENDKVQVKRINIIGNNVIPSDQLKGVMQTKEGDPFSWLTGSGSYREAVFERDIDGLRFYYGTMGYVRVRFGKPEVTVSPDKKWIYITFFVEEGDQYRVGQVDFSGELLYTRQELFEGIELVEGDVFNMQTLQKETLRYTEFYSDLGYAFANVVPQSFIHDDTKTVDVTVEVEKGERFYIGKIWVSGNTNTKDRVIRRQLLIGEGELFNGSKKRLSRDNVMRLGFFDNVEFHQSTPKGLSNVVDIEIKVKERSTGQLIIGAGYAGQVGFTANAQLAQNNFLGNGQVASLSAQIFTGQNFYDFSLDFQEPYVGYSLWSAGGRIYQLRRELFTFSSTPTFSETKTGLEARLGHPVLDYTNLFLTYRLEGSWVPASSIIDQTIIPKSSVNGILSSAMATLEFDKRDDRFDPTRGHLWSLSSEYAGLGGSRRFLKSKGTFRFFHPIVWDLVFRFRFDAANISQVGDSPVPINELFIQGGLFDLRGYNYASVGPRRILNNPRDPVATPVGSTIVIGGHNQLLTTAEVTFPILKEARLKGVVFFDAGNAFDGFFAHQNPALYANFGWGFRWFTPIGPLRFEFGYPIVNGGDTKFIFTIGPPF